MVKRCREGTIMEKVITVSHAINTPTDISDFSSFVRMSDVEVRAIIFDLVLTVAKQDKKINSYCRRRLRR